MSFSPGRTVLLAGGWLLLLASCGSSPRAGMGELAASDPLQLAVLVSGGSFFSPDSAAADPENELSTTFRGPESEALGEAIPLPVLVDALDRGRAFVRVAADRRSAEQRARVAREGPTPEFLAECRAQGYDSLLVIRELQDRPIRTRGVNDRWPASSALWLLIGLGMFIPDHSYESEAVLRVELCDLGTGLPVPGTSARLASAMIDLSLIERGSLWGLIQSILIPPPLVGSDPEAVREQVLNEVQQDLEVALVTHLKGAAVRESLRAAAPLEIQVDRGRGTVALRSGEGLRSLRLRVDGQILQGIDAERFDRSVRASATPDPVGGGTLRYSAQLPGAVDGADEVQLLIQTLTGSTVSRSYRWTEGTR